MQDIKRNRRKMGNNSPVSSNINDIDEIREDSFSDEDMERGFKNKKHDHCDCEKEDKCGCDHHHNDCGCDHHHNDCDCDPCHNHNNHHCEPCEIESDDCFPNKCGPECCHP